MCSDEGEIEFRGDKPKKLICFSMEMSREWSPILHKEVDSWAGKSCIWKK